MIHDSKTSGRAMNGALSFVNDGKSRRIVIGRIGGLKASERENLRKKRTRQVLKNGQQFNSTEIF
jgi:hypothetical protein